MFKYLFDWFVVSGSPFGPVCGVKGNTPVALEWAIWRRLGEGSSTSRVGLGQPRVRRFGVGCRGRGGVRQARGLEIRKVEKGLDLSRGRLDLSLGGLGDLGDARDP